MTELLSEKDLVHALNEFRDVLVNYDYSEVKNVVFLNVDSLNTYMKTHENNPFERQYKDLEILFDKIIPFIPSNIPEEAIDAITKIFGNQHDDKELIKKNIQFNVKMDFIQMVKGIHSKKEWNELLNICKSIRDAKREYLTH